VSVPDLVGSAVADVVSLFQLPGSNFAGAMTAAGIQKVLDKRAHEAREIFLEELGQGLCVPSDPGTVDEFVAITYRYLSKAKEGAARLNLRLMARVVKGQSEGPGLNASQFLRYSDMLASLNREEVIYLATRHRVKWEHDASKAAPDWKDASAVNAMVEKALIPSVFPTRSHLDGTITALLRTGLVWPGAAGLSGGFVWQETPLLKEVADLAQFQQALDKESVQQP
jgi:hypothetical protein